MNFTSAPIINDGFGVKKIASFPLNVCGWRRLNTKSNSKGGGRNKERNYEAEAE